jgi:hypothetical protein
MYAPRTKGKKSEGHSLVALHSLLASPDASCLTRVSASKTSSALAVGSCGGAGAKEFGLVLDKQSGKHLVTALKSTTCVVRTAHTTVRCASNYLRLGCTEPPNPALIPFFTNRKEVRKRQAAARKASKQDFYDPRYLYNGASMQPCKDGGTLLQVVEAPVHDVGFWLTASDGSCFDGTMFRTCDASAAALVWGWGLRFGGKSGESKYLYKWHDPATCLRRDKVATALDACDASGEWRLSILGELSSDRGKYCVVRSLYNEVRMVKCSAAGNQYEALAITPRR